jgi:hypothetical protein
MLPTAIKLPKPRTARWARMSVWGHAVGYTAHLRQQLELRRSQELAHALLPYISDIMKKLLTLSAIALVASQAAQAQIVSWTFEPDPIPTNVTNASIGPFSPATGTGNATGSHAATNTAWSSPAGNGSSNSLSANNWASGDYFQFELSTLTFSNIGVTFDMTKSGTGPTNWTFSYSTNGSSFTSFTNFAVSAITWNVTTYNPTSTYSFDLSTVSDLNNWSSVFFRVVNNDSPAGGGTARVDNFSVVPEPSSIALLALAGLGAGGYMLRRLRRR